VVELGDKATRIDAGHGRPPRKFGILAGWGRYPFIIAESLRRQGVEVYCLGVSGHAEPGLEQVCDHFEWIGLCKIGRAIRHFKRHGVTDVTMIGKIHKVVLYQPWRWLKHLPDLTTIRIFFPHFFTRRKDCRDDTLLGAVIEAFAAEGIRFGVATDYAPDLLAREGQLTERGPSAAQWRDIEFGWDMAKRMGGLDVGQSVCVKDQAVMAVEAVEGTDLCIQRAGTLCRAGGFTVVKVAKPRQDMRFDVPTVGIRTLRTMLDAGAKVLAIEAGRTILLEQAEAIDFANQKKLVLVSLVRPDIAPRPQNEDASSASSDCPQCPATLPHHFPVPETRR
jgi:UDP-2,3-diacylglucosamine hydrolase